MRVYRSKTKGELYLCNDDGVGYLLTKNGVVPNGRKIDFSRMHPEAVTVEHLYRALQLFNEQEEGDDGAVYIRWYPPGIRFP